MLLHEASHLDDDDYYFLTEGGYAPPEDKNRRNHHAAEVDGYDHEIDTSTELLQGAPTLTEAELDAIAKYRRERSIQRRRYQ